MNFSKNGSRPGVDGVAGSGSFGGSGAGGTTLSPMERLPGPGEGVREAIVGRVGVVLPRPDSLFGEGRVTESGECGECDDAELGDRGGVLAVIEIEMNQNRVLRIDKV